MRASREVILSGGAINSPQILELSGVGDGERLRELGIEAAHHLPGVGENLQDHFATRMSWRVTRSITYNEKTRGAQTDPRGSQVSLEPDRGPGAQRGEHHRLRPDPRRGGDAGRAVLHDPGELPRLAGPGP